MIFFKYLPHTYQGADHTGRRVLNMGGGGGGTSTTYTSNIPDWLRPQTEALLGAGTQEYFNTQFNPETGGYDIIGTKPYTPYSTDPRDYVAGFTPAQEQVFGEAARMETPGGFGQGAGLTTMSAINAMTPSSYQPYMSPYIQDVLNIQKQQAVEDAQRAQLGANLGAARSGTYGGARQTLLQGQREAGLQKTLSDIQAQGLQSAYDRARQDQQFGITTGMQAGSQLANIAAGQQQADLARLGFQGQMGDIQQQQQQRIIDQAIQDYALSQEMPFQRLAGYNALLRGYATPTTTVSQYSAVNPLQALGAVGTAAGGFGTLMGAGKKAGGVIKYAGGGGITDRAALESFAERASIPQLQQSMQSGELKGKEYIAAPILQNKVVNEERIKAAQAAMADNQQQGGTSILDGLMAKADELQGITAIAEPVTAAGGGMVAFAGGDLVQHGNYMSRAELNKYLDLLRKRGVDPKTIEAVKNQKYGLTRAALSRMPSLGLAGLVAVPGVLATDALMSTDTGERADQGYDYGAEDMISGITPGSAGPRTAQGALEAGQELIGGVGRDIFSALAPTGYQTVRDEARIAEAAAGKGPNVERNSEALAKAEARKQEMDKAQAAAASKPAATAAKPGAGKTKPEGGISTELDNILKGMEDTGQQGGMGQQQGLKDFADQYLKERAAYAGEDLLAQKLKERAEKEPSIYDRLSSAGAQIGLAGSMLSDPSRYGEYAQQAAGLRAAEAKARDEREMDYIKAMDRERQNMITAFDKAEQRMSDKEKQSTQFKHEKALQTDRLKVQAAGIKVQELSALATAANTRALKKASEYRQASEFIESHTLKMEKLFDDRLKALKESNDFMALKSEEQKKQVEAIEAARRLAMEQIDRKRQELLWPGYKLVAQQ